ncbi:TasA family protein [Nocardioides sp. SOB77]|uniref:TasA family protein n=1 Tax=Nocardioides oceani TaxID=3058369 RepID=A0ABT8FHL0_9ACTN|nr:TasA family protein [Nocardioides oceani]MDN4174024.1 TasA family protein [Nocardioides oceani]
MRTITRKNRTTAAKIAASVVLVAGGASVAGLGTFGAFTSTTSASESVTNGRVEIGLAEGVQGASVAATGIVPGDTIQRTFTLTRGSDIEKFGKVTMTTAGTKGSKLVTDTQLGLQLSVDQCATPWTTVGTTKELTCATTPVSVVASRPVVGSLVDLGTANLDALNAAGTSNLRVTLTLPAAADNSFQAASDVIAFTFDATQRNGEFR